MRAETASRSLCRLRAAHRAGKHHPAAQDHHAGDRRQCLERTHHRAQEGRFGLARSCASSAPRADEIKAISGGVRRRGKDSSPKDGYKLRVLLAPGGDAKRLQPVRVIVATDTSVEAMVALVRQGQIRRRRRAQRQQRGVVRRATRRTTARACGSTRASTRPRCATRCRAR